MGPTLSTNLDKIKKFKTSVRTVRSMDILFILAALFGNHSMYVEPTKDLGRFHNYSFII